MKENISSIGKTEEHLMSTVAKMKKEDQLLFGRSIMARTRNGELFMSINQRKNKLQDFIKTMVCIATDHSISDQDSQ
jgi:hypothetical protein